MIKSIRSFSLALLILGLCLCAASVYQSVRVPDLVEYVTPAASNARDGGAQGGALSDPDAALYTQGEGAQPPAAASTALSSDIEWLDEHWEEIDKVAFARTVWGYTESASVSEQNVSANSATTPIYSIGPGYASVYPMLLLSGRLMYPDELKFGDPVALLDEGLALKLFQTTDAVDKQIIVNNQVYRVVGTVAGKRAMGEPAEYRLYLPLTAVVKSGAVDVHQLIVAAAPMPASGAYEVMKVQMSQWNARGTLNDTRREREMTLIGLRWVSAFLATALIIWILKRHVALGARWVETIRARLREQYMIRLLPGAAGRAILWALGLGALAVCAYFVFTYIMRPVLIFPEWVPAVPVEPESIYSTFWNLQWENNKLMELRTPSILRLRHFGTMANVGMCLSLLGLLLTFAKARKKKEA